MKKLNKKRIAILIFLVIVVIFEIIAFKDSRANKMIEVTLATIDNSGFLDVEETTIYAINGEESGYYIFLPEYINEKKAVKYIVKQQTIKTQNKDTNKENSIKENIVEENIVNQIEENVLISNEIESNTKTTVETTEIIEEIVEKLPNDKIFLTEEEVKNKSISIKVEYDNLEKEEQKYYYKQIEQKINNHIVKIKGYMPLDAKVKVEEAKQEEIDKIKQEYESVKVTLKVAYDIKIITGNKEYEPSEIDKNVEVIISGIEELSNKTQKHKVIHVKDETLEEINEVKTKNDEISFETDSFSTYAVLLDSTETIDTLEIYQAAQTALSNEASIWDGTIANSFRFGNGTKEFPYLITNASELAYLAQQVNYWNLYENTYFQLVRDINLDGREWTPIGGTGPSFRGVFDGAGHIITNAKITIPSNLPTNQIDSYGIFGSIGGNENVDTIVKDLEISDINIILTASGNTNTTWSQRGYHIGILAGNIYQRGKISNIIVKNSTISDTNIINIQENVVQISVGGIAGYASQNPWGNSDPGEGKRYIIENCFSNVDINLDITLDQINHAAQYHSGGIIGTIRSQNVWPINCLYVGQNNAKNAFTGPIFGALINNTNYQSSENYSVLWNGNDAGDLSLNNGYYNSYSSNGTNFDQTITEGISTYRISSLTSNIGSVQGVNKGIYMSDISYMLTKFNDYNQNDIIWYFANNTYYLVPRISTTVEKDMPIYTVDVINNYKEEPYIYTWYINNQEDTSITGNVLRYKIDKEKDNNITVLTTDGEYYSVSEFVIPKLSLYIEFTPNYTNNSVSAKISGESLSYIDISEYTYEWYKEDIAGDEIQLIEGKTTTKLNDLEEFQDYRLVAKHNEYEELNIEGSFLYGNRTLIYVNYQNGNDNNDGKTPDRPLKTLTRAYSYLDANGTVKSNVIVLTGNYTNNDYISANNNTNRNNFSKRATLTGKYKGTDYNSGMYFGANDNNVGRTLFADTCIQNMRLYGSTNSNGRGATYFFLQGHSLTMGNELYFERYNSTQNTNALVDNSPAPDFHIIGGFSNYNQNNLPSTNNNGTITIKSGTYARIIAGSRNTQVNNTSHNFTGTKDNPFNMKIIIDIKKSTTASNYKYDVNLLVGGQTDGNVYANTNLEIRNGKLGRILGGSIRL